MLDLEEDLIRTLDFSLRQLSPVQFLERFLRLFGLDNSKAKTSKKLKALAAHYCRFMLQESLFLRFRPSQIAAASLLFSINLMKSDVMQAILELEKFPKGNFDAVVR